MREPVGNLRWLSTGTDRGDGRRSPPQDAAGPLAGAKSVLPSNSSVDHDERDPLRGASGVDEVADVADTIRVEDDGIGIGALTQHAAILKAEPLCRKAGHPTHRVFQREQRHLAHIVADDARKDTPQAGMRMTVMRQTVGADHRVLVGEDRLDVPFVELEIDRACGQETPSRIHVAAGGLMDTSDAITTLLAYYIVSI